MKYFKGRVSLNSGRICGCLGVLTDPVLGDFCCLIFPSVKLSKRPVHHCWPNRPAKERRTLLSLEKHLRVVKGLLVIVDDSKFPKRAIYPDFDIKDQTSVLKFSRPYLCDDLRCKLSSLHCVVVEQADNSCGEVSIALWLEDCFGY